MTLIKIDRKEKDALAYCCALINIPVTFYTVEENEFLIAANIEEKDPVMCFKLGDMFRQKIELESLRYLMESKRLPLPEDYKEVPKIINPE